MDNSETEKLYQDTWDVYGWAMCYMAQSMNKIFEDREDALEAFNGKFKDAATPDLHDLISRCIHIDPTERPQNVLLLQEEICTIMDDINNDRNG